MKMNRELQNNIHHECRHFENMKIVYKGNYNPSNNNESNLDK